MKTIEVAANEWEKKLEDAHVIFLGKDIINTFKEAVAFAQRWISVEDELPEHRQRVLFKSERFEYAGAGVYDYATFRDHDNNIVFDVTHWRPIELE